MEQVAISIKELLGISSAVAVLISIAIGAIWLIFFNRIKEGQKAEFQKQIEEQKAEFCKEIENLKAKNEKTNYITKTQFDAEFKMYQELSEKIFETFLCNSSLFPYGIDTLPENKDEQKKVFENRYIRANDNLITFQNALFKYAPFICEELYKLIDDFRLMAQSQVKMYPYLKFDETFSNEHKMKMEYTDKTKELESKHNKIINELRKYLKSLKVQEELYE